jgi:UDP-N-acetylmuramoyl-L-alanyl-D-glutamate--2,6-diaminopimelate ligase
MQTEAVQIQTLLDELPDVRSITGAVHPETVVMDVKIDSRLVTVGDLFVSVAPPPAGSLHIERARAAGAEVIIGPSGSYADVVVDDPARAAALISCVFFGRPSEELTVLAVTGTNGKSSVTHTTGGILRTLGCDVGSIGTIGISMNDEPVGGSRRTPTTPESVDLQRLMRHFADRGASHVVMEASSIALAERRVEGTAIDVGCFTNLSHDHLDVHGSPAAYEAAKLHLFDLSRTPVANLDDPVGRRIRDRHSGTRTFGLHSPADLVATDLHRTPDGTAFTVRTRDGEEHDGSVAGLGEMSVSNGLAAVASVAATEVPIGDAVAALAKQPGPPGRMQIVPIDRDVTVMIDYAHSPDALAKVLRAVRPTTDGRVLTVFGCGGDRDRSKRPIMGQLAADLSDEVIITTDNPRTENPDRITTEILAGVPDDADGVRVIIDRSDAIAAALQAARPGDLVLIAGKGSEDYQLIGTEKIPYSDERVVLQLAGSNGVHQAG